SRRRHTRLVSDWSSDVCSSDLRFVVVSTPRRELVAALCAGVGRCRGEYVARMDADDLMHRERLAVQTAALDAAPQLTAVGAHVQIGRASCRERAEVEGVGVAMQ